MLHHSLHFIEVDIEFEDRSYSFATYHLLSREGFASDFDKHPKKISTADHLLFLHSRVSFWSAYFIATEP